MLDLHRGTLSWRRLLVLYRALPDDSTTRIYERGQKPWSIEAVLLDEIRRNAILIATRGEHRPGPTPGSPVYEQEQVEREKAASQRQREHEAAEAREARRQERIAVEKARRENRCLVCGFVAKSPAGAASHLRSHEREGNV